MVNNKLTGVNVKLRALEPGDIGVLYEWENDTTVWDAGNTLTPFSRFQIESYILNEQNDLFASRQLRLMVELVQNNADGKPAGTIDLFDFDPVNFRGGVGLLIREPFRGKGYGTEAMEIFIRYAFGTLRLHQLYCNISPDNKSSLTLFRKLGFVQCGIKKGWNRDGDGWKDEWMFQLISHGG